jgi:hypothetical protein
VGLGTLCHGWAPWIDRWNLKGGKKRIFERRGREDYAENAKEEKERKKEEKVGKIIQKLIRFYGVAFIWNFNFGFLCLLLRSLRILRALCVQKGIKKVVIQKILIHRANQSPCA